MQETLTFPTISSPHHHRFTSSQSYFTDYSERCSPISTPFVSAPSSPGNGGFYFSAPTSPRWAHISTAAHEGILREYPPSIPLHWDEKPGTPRRKSSGKDEAGSFLTTSDFEFSARFTEEDDPSMSPTPMSSANELFCNGQIKPLRIPTTCMEYASSSSSTGRSNTHGGHTTYRMNINEHAPSSSMRTSKQGVGSLQKSKHAVGSHVPFAFEFCCRSELVGSSNSSISAPHSPRFSSTLGCSDAAQSAKVDLNRGKPASSLSLPPSPRSPLNRVKGALCGISPSRIDRAFDTSMHMAVRSSHHNSEVLSRVDLTFGTSMQAPPEASSHPLEASKQAMESFQRAGRSVLSLGLRSQGASHRRTKSFSPLRIFQRNDHPPSYPSASSSSIKAPTMEDEIPSLPQDVPTKEKQHDGGDPTSAQKGYAKKWTLKDLLHRRSGGENRSNSSRSSSRRSGASADSTSSVEKMCRKSSSGGRSSSESLHSFASSSTHTGTKDIISPSSTSSSRAKIVARDSADVFDYANSNEKVPTNMSCSVRTQSHNSSPVKEDKLKSSTQKGGKAHVWKGSKRRSMSSSEVQWSVQKAQSEMGSLCEVNAREGQLMNMHQGQPVRGTSLCEVNNNNNIHISNNGKAKSTNQRAGVAKQKGNKGCISPHEMHYVMHKQQTEELRKKTFLPYRQGLLGCLGFTSRSYRTVSTISKTLQSVSG